LLVHYIGIITNFIPVTTYITPPGRNFWYF